jgi:membrane-associated phospholipid phosphatase
MKFPAPSQLTNAFGPRWFECCWRIYTPRWLLPFGELVTDLLNPILVNEILELFIVANFLVPSPHQRDVAALHRVALVPMVTFVGLYLVFRRRRPGVVAATGRTLGTAYGMPSGDSILAAVAAAAIFPSSRAFALLVAASVGASRLVRGFHTVPQVAAGLLIGAAIAWLAASAGNAFVVANWLCAALLPPLAWFDRAQKDVRPGDFGNVTIWVIWNFPTLLFDVIVCAPDGADILGAAPIGARLVVVLATRLLLKVVGFRLMKAGKVISFV